ncbi:hypothetical protein PG994_015050 [Apiospora phragmitis]|uniref:non-specific serine/threonine protein kinase n=1 Tax=Apiospora phragmitis TaxID=2905665 RepID=A0ABR1SXK8_9PEZI
MSELPDSKQWMKESIDEWFTQRPKPSQMTLDSHAKAVLKGSSVRPVELQGSLSYTVVVTTERIVSFRVPEQGLGGVLEKLAAQIHGDVVPEATNHGMIGNGEDEEKAGQPLHVVSMPFIPGKAYYEVEWKLPVLDEAALKKQLTFNLHLARYFARAWNNSQPVSESKLHEQRQFMLGKLAIIKKKPQFDYMKPHVDELEGEGGIGHLSSNDYPQVLTHDDLSYTNILVNEETFAIQGIIDWSLAKIAPFGWDYLGVRKLNGIAPEESWIDSSDRSILERCFWDEFFAVAGITDVKEQLKVQHHATLAAKHATIIHYCFCKELDGTTVDLVHPEPPCYVDGWLGSSSWDRVVQGRTEIPVCTSTESELAAAEAKN